MALPFLPNGLAWRSFGYGSGRARSVDPPNGAEARHSLLMTVIQRLLRLLPASSAKSPNNSYSSSVVLLIEETSVSGTGAVGFEQTTS